VITRDGGRWKQCYCRPRLHNVQRHSCERMQVGRQLYVRMIGGYRLVNVWMLPRWLASDGDRLPLMVVERTESLHGQYAGSMALTKFLVHTSLYRKPRPVAGSTELERPRTIFATDLWRIVLDWLCSDAVTSEVAAASIIFWLQCIHMAYSTYMHAYIHIHIMIIFTPYIYTQ